MKFVADPAACDPPLNLPKYWELTDGQEELYWKSLIVTTDIGVVVFGTTAKLVVCPVAVFVSRNANASENKHWKFPYSSDAKIKSKLKLGEIGVKSNSNTVAFLDDIIMPAAAKVFSKLVSPVHEASPSFNKLAFGPIALVTFPVLNTTPLCIGKFGFVFEK